MYVTVKGFYYGLLCVCDHQEVERLTLENSKLAEESQDLHRTVETLQEKNREVEASLEEKANYLLRLAEEIASREEKILTNEQLLTNAHQKVCRSRPTLLHENATQSVDMMGSCSINKSVACRSQLVVWTSHHTLTLKSMRLLVCACVCM